MAGHDPRSVLISTCVCGFVLLTSTDAGSASEPEASAQRESSVPNSPVVAVRIDLFSCGMFLNADGSGRTAFAMNVHGTLPVTFPPGTFAVAMLGDAIRPRLTTEKPSHERIESRIEVSITDPATKEVTKYWPSDLSVVADLFEMSRQAARIHGGESVAEYSKLWCQTPPTPISKRWDAPVPPPAKTGIALPPAPSRKNQDQSGTISPIVLSIHSYGWTAYVTRNGAAAFGERNARYGAYLPGGTLNVAALCDWLQPQLSTSTAQPPTRERVYIVRTSGGGQSERLWLRTPQVMGELFELFRYAYKAQKWCYPRVERDWYEVLPNTYCKPWEYPLRWTPLMDRLLSPSLKPASATIAATRGPEALVWLSIDNFTLVIHKDRSGLLLLRDLDSVDESRPLFEIARVVFPPGTFHLEGMEAKWKPHLQQEPTNEDACVGLFQFAVKDGTKPDGYAYLWPKPFDFHSANPVSDVCELFRQACHRLPPPGLKAIATQWEKVLARFVAKPWDAPLDGKQ